LRVYKIEDKDVEELIERGVDMEQLLNVGAAAQRLSALFDAEPATLSIQFSAAGANWRLHFTGRIEPEPEVCPDCGGTVDGSGSTPCFCAAGEDRGEAAMRDSGAL